MASKQRVRAQLEVAGDIAPLAETTGPRLHQPRNLLQRLQLERAEVRVLSH